MWLGPLEAAGRETLCASAAPGPKVGGSDFRLDVCFRGGRLVRVRLAHDTEGSGPTPYVRAKAELVELYGKPTPPMGNPWSRRRTWVRGATTIELSELQLPAARITEINFTHCSPLKSASLDTVKVLGTETVQKGRDRKHWTDELRDGPGEFTAGSKLSSKFPPLP
jgi:hypothetical protein